MCFTDDRTVRCVTLRVYHPVMTWVVYLQWLIFDKDLLLNRHNHFLEVSVDCSYCPLRSWRSSDTESEWFLGFVPGSYCRACGQGAVPSAGQFDKYQLHDYKKELNNRQKEHFIRLYKDFMSKMFQITTTTNFTWIKQKIFINEGWAAGLLLSTEIVRKVRLIKYWISLLKDCYLMRDRVQPSPVFYFIYFLSFSTINFSILFKSVFYFYLNLRKGIFFHLTFFICF